MFRTATAMALALMVAGCNESGQSSAPPISAPAPTPTPTPAPTPPATSADFDVLPCFFQTVPGTGGRTVAGLVIPDVVTVNLANPPFFPNGRRLTDSVIDLTLAVIFLDLTRHSPGALTLLPLGPQANDVPFRAAFPYLAPAQGNPPLSGTTGSNFNFRTDPVSAFVQVDRMGMPAVATALISTPQKTAYNDASPAVDFNGDFVAELAATLTPLANGLADDFVRLGLTPCAVRR